jgi:energy-coupling factor transport system permease protein
MFAGARRAALAGLRMGLGLALLIVVVNALAVDRGETVLLRLGTAPLLGRVDVTGEALAAGAVIGLRAAAVMVVFAVYSACVDPDRVLRALRPFAGRSALTAALISRLAPVAAADAARIREAARLRGPAAAPVGRGALARRVLAGSLDRAVDVAATLELRGYGMRAPRARPHRHRSRHDARFFTAGAVVLCAAIAASALGAGTFDAYPTIALGLGPGTVGLAVLVAIAGIAPLRRRPPRVRRLPRPGRGSLEGAAGA